MKKNKTFNRKPGIVELFNQHKGLCFYCDIQMTLERGKPETVTKDHVIPKCQGGLTNKFNIVAACQECNSLKADMSLSDFKLVLRNKKQKSLTKTN